MDFLTSRWNIRLSRSPLLSVSCEHCKAKFPQQPEDSELKSERRQEVWLCVPRRNASADSERLPSPLIWRRFLIVGQVRSVVGFDWQQRTGRPHQETNSFTWRQPPNGELEGYSVCLPYPCATYL